MFSNQAINVLTNLKKKRTIEEIMTLLTGAIQKTFSSRLRIARSVFIRTESLKC